MIGEETKPKIKYEVGGIPFESPIQISQLCKLSEMDCRNRIESKNPIYRHWKKVDDWDISYDEMEAKWNDGIVLEYPIIECDGRWFYSLKEAGVHFGISNERVRQKLNDDKFKEWKYLYNRE